MVDFKKVLLGNIDRVEIRRTIPIDLETLLMMNSRNISSYRSLLTDKELNTFIKLWLKGTNRNLERLFLSYYYSLQRRGIVRTFNENVILEGIEHQFLVDEERVSRLPSYHIWKSDGTLAKMYFEFSVLYLKVRHSS